jgi:CMP-N,N'-diacetyllegionaminic acid synthase
LLIYIYNNGISKLDLIHVYKEQIYMNNKKIFSLIPARGGSKGIVKKALIELNNKPLIFHSITASVKSNVDETWVSSDDMDILTVSSHFGAKQIVRPSEFAQDDSPLEDVIKHFLSKNLECEIIVLIQPTSPLIKSVYINEAIQKFLDNKYDSLFCCCICNDLLIWKTPLTPINYDYKNRGRRQDKRDSEIIIENGMFYIFTREHFEKTNCRLGGNIGIYEIPFWKSFEIDDINDLGNIKKLM